MRKRKGKKNYDTLYRYYFFQTTRKQEIAAKLATIIEIDVMEAEPTTGALEGIPESAGATGPALVPVVLPLENSTVLLEVLGVEFGTDVVTLGPTGEEDRVLSVAG